MARGKPASASRRREDRENGKRVLLCANYFLPHRDGVANYASSLARHLSKLGNDVTILTFNTDNVASDERWEGMRVVRLPCRNLLSGTYTLPKKNEEYSRLSSSLGKFDTIITNTRFFPMTWLGGRLARKTGARWIHVEHGNRFVKHQNPFVSLVAWLVDQTLGKWVFRSANITVGIAPANVAFARRMGAKKTAYIPNAIELERFKKVKTDLRERLGIAPEEKVVVFTGRLIKMKGVHDLIDAMKGVDACLLVVGDGPERPRLETQAKEAGVRAHFLGKQDEHGVIEALSIADVFVNPSYSEGMPTSVLEAAAMGLPIVATDVGGTKEILTKEELITPGDSQGLVRIIKNKLKERGRKRNLTRFTWDENAKRFEGIL